MASKRMKKRVSEMDLSANPEIEQLGVHAGDEIDIEVDDGVPEFVLRADSAFGRAVMFGARDYAQLLDAEDGAAFMVKVREFDLHEESMRMAEAGK